MSKPKCRCTHEAGDSRCDAHPTCEYCGEPIAVSAETGRILAVLGRGTGRYCSAECRGKGE